MTDAASFRWSWPGWVKTAAKRIRPILVPSFLAVTVLFAGTASWSRWCEIYELQAYDWRCGLIPPSPQSKEALIVEIWDDALESIGRWPFDRQFHGFLLYVLKAHRAKAAGMDILFAEPSSSDDALARSAQEYGKAFFCEAMVSPRQQNGRPTSPKVLVPLLEQFQKVSAGVAHVNILPDPDGKRRRVMPVIWENDKPRFQLGIRLAMNSLGVSPEQVRFGPGWIDLGGKVRVPVDENGATLLRFHGKWSRAFERISYLQILTAYKQELNGEKPAFDLDRLRDRVCFVGLTATGTHDINAVPVDYLYPQVGVHADFFQNVVEGDFMSRLPRWVNLLMAILLGAISWFISRMRHLLLGAAAFLGGWAIFIASNVALFVYGHRWLDLFYPSIIYMTIYLSATIWRTMQEKRKRELIEAELSIASRIQRSLLPASLPEVPGYEVDVFMQPAKHVGGDLYAVLLLDERHLGIMCGDVSGKGMPAALFMARAVSEFKFCAASGFDPAETLRRLNNGLAEGDTSGLFVTVNYAVVDLTEKHFVLSNGGHMPVVRIRSGGETDQFSPDGGMPIGLMTDVEFGRIDAELQPGDIFLMYTDGVSEARNRRIQDFEIERVIEIAKKHRLESAAQIREQILNGLREFVGSAPQHDDMTLLVFKVKD